MREAIMKIYLRIVKFTAHLLRCDVFCAAEKNGVGYVVYSNNGSNAITYLKNAQIEWEEANG